MAEIKIQLRDFDNNILGDLDIISSESFPLSLSYSNFDVRNFNSRTGSFSKTFKIPASKKNNKLLNHIYQYGNDDTKKVLSKIPATIFADNLPIITGNLRITQIFKNTKVLEYECLFLGNNMDWADSIKSLNMSELKFSSTQYTSYSSLVETDYTFSNPKDEPFSDHSFTLDRLVYPYITVGQNDSPQDQVMSSDFVPHVYVKNVWDKIFNAQGYTVISTFCNSDFFKNLLMPLIFRKPKNVTDVSGGKFSLSADEDLHEFDFTNDAGNSITVPRSIDNESYSLVFSNVNKIETEVTLPFILGADTLVDDAPSATNTSGNAQFGHLHETNVNNGLCVSSQGSGVFNLSGTLILNVKGSGGSSNFIAKTNYEVEAEIVKKQSDDDTTINSSDTTIQSLAKQEALVFTATNTSNPSGDLIEHTFNFNAINISANQGDKFVILIKFKHKESNSLSAGTPKVKIIAKAGSFLQIEQTSAFFNGQTISGVGKLLPQGKQIDFVKGIAQLFNLQFHTDAIAKKVFVEPYDHFYKDFSSTSSTDALDWTDKIDYSREIKDEFIHEIKSRLILKYKDANNDGMLNAFNARNDVEWGAYKEDFADGNFSTGELVIENSYFSPTFNWYEPNYIYNVHIARTPIIPMYFTEFSSLDLSGAVERPEKDFKIGARILLACKPHSVPRYDGDGFPEGNTAYGTYIAERTYISSNGLLPYVYVDSDDDATTSSGERDLTPSFARFISFDNLTIDYGYNGSNGVNINTPPHDRLRQVTINNGYEEVDFNLSFSDVSHETVISTSAQELKGLYQVYYSKMIQQLKKNPRLKVVYLNLTHMDISRLDFRNLIYLDGYYYRINKIIDYKPHSKTSTKCELQQYFKLGKSASANDMVIDIENINI